MAPKSVLHTKGKMARAEHLISSNRMAMRILTLPEAAKDKTPKVISAHEIGIGEGFNMGTFEPLNLMP